VKYSAVEGAMNKVLFQELMSAATEEAAYRLLTSSNYKLLDVLSDFNGVSA